MEEPVGSRCPVCSGGFVGVMVYKTFKGRHYHTDCLRCAGCGASVGSKMKPAAEFEARVYCETCVELCPGCNLPVCATFLELNGKKYHETCFRCMRCTTRLGQEVYLLDNEPACLKCCEEVHAIRQADMKGMLDWTSEQPCT